MLKRWLALFAEHYRQPISELSAVAYQVGMEGSDCTPADIEAGCTLALQRAEFMPTVALIRRECELQKFHRTIKEIDVLEETESEERKAKWEEMHQRNKEYCESIKAKTADPLPPPVVKREPVEVIATPERLNELAKQAEIIKRKYPPNDIRLKQAEALAER